MISIIDYGGGNIGSVKNALDYLRIENEVTDNKETIRKSDKIILPGQGRFGDVMEKLRQKDLDAFLAEQLAGGKPYLGICIGMQILFDSGEEDPETKGLGVFRGRVPRFRTKLKVPQVGWNSLAIKKESRLFRGINNPFFYFVHSFYAEPEDKNIVLCETQYGNGFVSGIEKDNLFAVQFHPEKSGKDGLQLLKNFGDLECQKSAKRFLYVKNRCF